MNLGTLLSLRIDSLYIIVMTNRLTICTRPQIMDGMIYLVNQNNVSKKSIYEKAIANILIYIVIRPNHVKLHFSWLS